jgi:AcrR family transcriptional regulator
MSPAGKTARLRPLRQDAARNRSALLAAAAGVFDMQGLDASVTDVARAAGLGMGTLYRHFPTKAALIDALVHDVLEATIQMAHDASHCDDGAGLEQFLEASARYQAEHSGCLPRLWDTDHKMVKTARHLIAGLLADAQKSGRVRKDLTTTDLTMTMFSLRGVIEATLPVAPDAWRRHLDLLIAGMRPDLEELAHPAVNKATLDKILGKRNRLHSESESASQ